MWRKREGLFSTVAKLLLWLRQITAIAIADFQKLKHDPSELITRATQPVVWLVIFGESFSNMHAIHIGNHSYLDFIAPGILAQSILFMAIFFGVALIWERDMGILHKILVTPAPRITLVLGRAAAAGVRSISQVFVVYLLSFFLGINLRLEWVAFLGVFVCVVMGAAIFSTFSLIIASIVKKRERFMGIGQVLSMPLFFASNALYPIEIMPPWIQVVSKLNPLTYQVDALRSLMIAGQTSHFGLDVDFLVGIITLTLLVAIATVLYPKILY